MRVALVLARSSCALDSGDPGSCETWRSAGAVPLGKTLEPRRGRFLRRFRADGDVGAAGGLPGPTLARARRGSAEQLAAEPLLCPGAFLPSAACVRARGRGIGARLRTGRSRPPLSCPGCRGQQRPCQHRAHCRRKLKAGPREGPGRAQTPRQVVCVSRLSAVDPFRG